MKSEDTNCVDTHMHQYMFEFALPRTPPHPMYACHLPHSLTLFLPQDSASFLSAAEAEGNGENGSTEEGNNDRQLAAVGSGLLKLSLSCGAGGGRLALAPVARTAAEYLQLKRTYQGLETPLTGRCMCVTPCV